MDFDGELGLLRLEGESHPEEAAQFYAPLILWLDALITSPPASVVFELRLTFFSAATRPQLLALLRRLKKWANRGATVRATWYIDPGDEDMVERRRRPGDDVRPGHPRGQHRRESLGDARHRGVTM
ncbi:SiaC family regulatory phosphoprotein [Nannocystis pusilla]|uniref:SiaC family regulatory phosphoprotein n=1 Tax=Nannocystis pusilla TaxID=889268 RepID=UPI003DA1EC2B